MRDSEKRAQARYKRENVKRLQVPLYPKDADIWAHIEGVRKERGGYADYVRGLIRADMERG